MKKIASQTTATLTRNGMLALASAIASGLPAARLPEHEEHDLDDREPGRARIPPTRDVKPPDETR